MATASGRVQRDLVGGSLRLNDKLVIDRNFNICSNQLTPLNGTFTIDGDLMVTGNINGSTPGPSETPNNITTVSKIGDDSTGERNNSGKPFLTIGAAVAASLLGDLIIVCPGVYDEFDLLSGFSAVVPANLDFYFHPGAIVQPTGTTVGGNPGTAPIFFLNRAGLIRIYGYGQFINIGNGENDTCAVTACSDPDARIEVDCVRVSSVEAWGNGSNGATQTTVIVKNALIDWIISVYASACMILDNCRVWNTGPIGLDYFARFTTFKARNCLFYRDFINTDYFTLSTGASTNIHKMELAAPSSLFTLHTKQKPGFVPNSDDFSAEFYNCNFVNRYIGASGDDTGHGIWFNNFDGTVGSRLILDDCRFDIADLTNGAAIYYTRFFGVAPGSFNPPQAGPIPETKSFLSNCTTNKDVVLATYLAPATNTNEFTSGFEVSSIYRMSNRF